MLALKLIIYRPIYHRLYLPRTLPSGLGSIALSFSQNMQTLTRMYRKRMCTTDIHHILTEASRIDDIVVIYASLDHEPRVRQQSLCTNNPGSEAEHIPVRKRWSQLRISACKEFMQWEYCIL